MNEKILNFIKTIGVYSGSDKSGASGKKWGFLYINAVTCIAFLTWIVYEYRFDKCNNMSVLIALAIGYATTLAGASITDKHLGKKKESETKTEGV